MEIREPMSAVSARNIGGRAVYVCAEEGPSLAADYELSGLIGELFGASAAKLVAIPAGSAWAPTS